MTHNNSKAAVGAGNPHPTAPMAGMANRLALACATYREGDVDTSFDIFIAAMREAEQPAEVATATVELSALIETALNNALCLDSAAPSPMPAEDDATSLDEAALTELGFEEDDWLSDPASAVPPAEAAGLTMEQLAEQAGVSFEELAAQGEADLRTRHVAEDWRAQLRPPAPALDPAILAANLAALDAAG